VKVHRTAAFQWSVITTLAADLVFIQNGMLQPWLDANGLSEATQALVYFAVAKLGEAPVDGKTRTNPEGLTAVCGPQAKAFCELLHAGGLSCQVCRCLLELLLDKEAEFRFLL
jgi:hypothetical protein